MTVPTAGRRPPRSHAAGSAAGQPDAGADRGRKPRAARRAGRRRVQPAQARPRPRRGPDRGLPPLREQGRHGPRDRGPADRRGDGGHGAPGLLGRHGDRGHQAAARRLPRPPGRGLAVREPYHAAGPARCRPSTSSSAPSSRPASRAPRPPASTGLSATLPCSGPAVEAGFLALDERAQATERAAWRGLPGRGPGRVPAHLAGPPGTAGGGRRRDLRHDPVPGHRRAHAAGSASLRLRRAPAGPSGARLATTGCSGARPRRSEPVGCGDAEQAQAVRQHDLRRFGQPQPRPPEVIERLVPAGQDAAGIVEPVVGAGQVLEVPRRRDAAGGARPRWPPRRGSPRAP